MRAEGPSQQGSHLHKDELLETIRPVTAKAPPQTRKPKLGATEMRSRVSRHRSLQKGALLQPLSS
ncbi:MAG: hypothetical protein AMJ93_14435 [Anaerolineae bacterium SM23_84]|nr:MAG: hypothetical protein AMJ93_14435 [Anaerolineae bacterium SM23_84]